MSLQWNFVAGFLYFEIFLLVLLMLPFIKAYMWQKIFRSRWLNIVTAYAHLYLKFVTFLLILLFVDAIREIRKYSGTKVDINLPEAETSMNMKMFRAQRNLYISGFAVLLLWVLNRISTLISIEATLTASNEASLKQARGASEQAQKLMKEIEELQKDSKRKLSRSNSMADVVVAAVADSEVTKELKSTKEEVANLTNELEKAKLDLAAFRKQAEGVNIEYDRLLTEHAKLQKQLEGQGEESKKDN
ncbi:B-cell receptor-associated protein 31-like [Anneissia japonica]|uniref:B-cell receptor-associated protein 31-like n=1 Tax=Anneissia japonica TaxID=1529436 RepID=UPI0014257FCB|nr:B-cell receptor-associated protein 31-like [Anneissia japonica]XP_033102314.1 B-cell receptor-associated protein 31-like [Anneissia japonica]XP_033102320.1 B-cell receptor-associated protein 31-like [Anneissia japonica]XP_033102326.1 B-cell receptor-associated protein 31-like [Anneissia japonica]XP_033102334.1 B-cell receptor-associated protein 31-like [Anneissia japonica]